MGDAEIMFRLLRLTPARLLHELSRGQRVLGLEITTASVKMISAALRHFCTSGNPGALGPKTRCPRGNLEKRAVSGLPNIAFHAMFGLAVLVVIFSGICPHTAAADSVTSTKYASNVFFNSGYLSGEDVPPQWTGNIDEGKAGTVSPAMERATRNRINWYRRMAGLPNITLRPAWNKKCRLAALMMSANGTLDHFPPESWRFYTSGGAEAAGKSNLGMGDYGPADINSLIADYGFGNYAIGHRRWLLYPPVRKMGVGMVVPDYPYYSAQATWVIGSTSDGSWSRTRPKGSEYVAWPPAGYVPSQVVFPRWSFSIAGADFSRAVVKVIRNGAPVGVSQQFFNVGYGDPTIVWEFPEESSSTNDVTYNITISNVRAGRKARKIKYSVVVYDPVKTPVNDPKLPPVGRARITPPLPRAG